MKRVLFTATVAEHIRAFHLPYLEWFKENGWETWVATNFGSHSSVTPFCDQCVQVDFDRSPFSLKTLTAYSQLSRLIDGACFDIVHCHTPVAGVLTRLAARRSRKRGTRVIYTAHGFHFYQGASPSGWAMWYPIEKLMAQYTDDLITINNEDYELARKSFPCRVHQIPGVGIDLSRFMRRDGRKEAPEIWSCGATERVGIAAVGELNRNKNHRVLVEALAQLPDNYELAIAGTGPMENELSTVARMFGVADRVHLLGYQDDVRALLNSADVFCMPSLREGLPVSLIEAAATGLPCVASDIRGCRDVLGDLPDCLTKNPQDASEWAHSIRLVSEPSQATRVSDYLANRARRFDIQSVLPQYLRIYENCDAGRCAS